jgi:sugar phosphate isomerase/epimerase
MLYTRREVGKLALSVLPAASLASIAKPEGAAAQTARPDSNFSGVQIGLNVPYSLGNNLISGDETLEACTKLGVSAVELRSQPVELFLGVPRNLIAPRSGRGTPTPEEQAAQKIAAEELRTWRLSVSMDKVKEFRKKYSDAGVLIEIVKFDGIYALPDDVVDYSFELAKALGARAISCEISLDGTKRIGQFADKHNMMVGYHGHAETKPEDWETAFSYARFNGANVDIGHFVAGNNESPVEFIKKHHDRITHLHVKDRKKSNGPNVPFGQGDTPIKDVLQLLKANRWKIQGTIEFEYPIPPGSDRLAEIAKCVQYCKEALS